MVNKDWITRKIRLVLEESTSLAWDFVIALKFDL